MLMDSKQQCDIAMDYFGDQSGSGDRRLNPASPARALRLFTSNLTKPLGSRKVIVTDNCHKFNCVSDG